MLSHMAADNSKLTTVIHWPVSTMSAQYVPCTSFEWHYASTLRH